MADKLTPKQGFVGREIVQKLIDTLGLPNDTVGISLRVYAGQFVTVECEYVLDDGTIAPALTEYDTTSKP